MREQLVVINYDIYSAEIYSILNNVIFEHGDENDGSYEILTHTMVKMMNLIFTEVINETNMDTVFDPAFIAASSLRSFSQSWTLNSSETEEIINNIERIGLHFLELYDVMLTVSSAKVVDASDRCFTTFITRVSRF